MQDRKKKGIIARRGNSNHSSREDIRGDQGNVICKKPLIAKLKAGVKLQVACSESDGKWLIFFLLHQLHKIHIKKFM